MCVLRRKARVCLRDQDECGGAAGCLVVGPRMGEVVDDRVLVVDRGGNDRRRVVFGSRVTVGSGYGG